MNAWTAVAILFAYYTGAYALLLWAGMLLPLPVTVGKQEVPRARGLAVAGLLAAATMALLWLGAWALWPGWLNPLLFGGLGRLGLLAAGAAAVAWVWLRLWLAIIGRLVWPQGSQGRLRGAVSVPRLVALGGGPLLLMLLLQLPQPLQVNRYVVSIPNLPAGLEGFRILHLTDIHYSRPAAGRLKARVAPLRSLHPDLVVGTGDYGGGGSEWSMREGVRLQLSIPAGRQLGVEGNHDVWTAGGRAPALLEESGLPLLHNRAVRLGPGCYLAGVGDPYTSSDDLPRALAGVPRGASVILLCHAPQLAAAAAGRGVALMLCGHTHGGLVNLPGLGPPRFLRVYRDRHVAGWYRVGGMLLLVNRGVAGKYRISCPPEAVMLTLRRAAPGAGPQATVESSP